jgi:hypothetical protein
MLGLVVIEGAGSVKLKLSATGKLGHLWQKRMPFFNSFKGKTGRSAKSQNTQHRK